LLEKLKLSLRKRLRCASDRHRPERYGAREVDGVWQSHCLDCQRMIYRVDDVWRSLRKDNPAKHRRR
jgi:hypothetical protein